VETSVPDQHESAGSLPALPAFLMENLGAVLNWMAGIVPQVYVSALAPLGVDGRHLAVLMTLKHMGPFVQAQLALVTRIDKATMVSLLNDLEQRSFIERRPHPSDRRAYQVHLTAQGEDFLQEADVATSHATDQLLRALSPSERQQLHEMLVRIA